jgi:uncharacterized alkaline shock family protein YloU
LASVGLIDLALLGLEGLGQRIAAESSWQSRVAIPAAALSVSLLAAGFLVRKRSGSQSHNKLHIMSADAVGMVCVSNTGLRTLVGALVHQQASVLDVDVRITGKEAGPLAVRLLVAVLPGTNVKEVGEEARRLATDALERLACMTVATVDVEVRIAFPERPGRVLE